MENIDYFFISKIKFNFDNFKWQKPPDLGADEISNHRIQEIVQFKDFDANTSSIVKNLINKIVKKKKLFGSRVEICQFQKTSKGGIFDWHVDYMSGQNCTSIIYLSDHTNGLIGGTTEFDLKNGQELKIITPKNGYCCCFDPKLLHRGSKVISGIKYSLVVVFNINYKVKTEFEINSMGQKKIIYYKEKCKFL